MQIKFRETTRYIPISINKFEEQWFILNGEGGLSSITRNRIMPNEVAILEIRRVIMFCININIIHVTTFLVHSFSYLWWAVCLFLGCCILLYRNGGPFCFREQQFTCYHWCSRSFYCRSLLTIAIIYPRIISWCMFALSLEGWEVWAV